MSKQLQALVRALLKTKKSGNTAWSGNVYQYHFGG